MGKKRIMGLTELVYPRRKLIKVGVFSFVVSILSLLS